MKRVFITTSPIEKRDVKGSVEFLEESNSVEVQMGIIIELIKQNINAFPRVSYGSLFLKKLKGLIGNKDVHINIGFNIAQIPQITGTKCYVSNQKRDSDIILGAELTKVISEVLGVHRRRGVLIYPGVKTISEFVDFSYNTIGKISLEKGIGSSIDLRICFLSNPYDRESFRKEKTRLINLISKIITKYIKECNG